MSADTERVEFAGSTGARLVGVLHKPEGGAKGSVLMAHCFTCSKDLHTMTRISKGLAEAGYAVFRFDFTGLGESGGEFTSSTISVNIKDLTRAATTLIQRGFGPCAMVGHSLGGAAAILAAARLKTAKSLVVIGAPSSTDHVRSMIGEGTERIRREGIAVVEIGGRPFPISKTFLEDLDRHEPTVAAAELNRPLLVMHALEDEIVSIEHGERIFASARQPKAFVPIFGADHLLTPRRSANDALSILIEWFGRTL